VYLPIQQQILVKEGMVTFIEAISGYFDSGGAVSLEKFIAFSSQLCNVPLLHFPFAGLQQPILSESVQYRQERGGSSNQNVLTKDYGNPMLSAP